MNDKCLVYLEQCGEILKCIHTSILEAISVPLAGL